MKAGFHTIRDKDSKIELKAVLSSAVNKKITQATLGSREDRSRLIKEQNRIIIYSVINSPKITDDEIVAYAGNKNLSKEVPFLISTEREFTKKYTVKVALVNNPKTPLLTSTKFLRHLTGKDLTKVAKSKNVPKVLSKTAFKMLVNKGE
jgi:hypothetical protein